MKGATARSNAAITATYNPNYNFIGPAPPRSLPFHLLFYLFIYLGHLVSYLRHHEDRYLSCGHAGFDCHTSLCPSQSPPGKSTLPLGASLLHLGLLFMIRTRGIYRHMRPQPLFTTFSHTRPWPHPTVSSRSLGQNLLKSLMQS